MTFHVVANIWENTRLISFHRESQKDMLSKKEPCNLRIGLEIRINNHLRYLSLDIRSGEGGGAFPVVVNIGKKYYITRSEEPDLCQGKIC